MLNPTAYILMTRFIRVPGVTAGLLAILALVHGQNFIHFQIVRWRNNFLLAQLANKKLISKL